MEAKGLKWGPTAGLMSELGFNRYDASLGYAISRSSPLRKEFAEALQRWVEAVEVAHAE
jgi:hypothetical protein